jgi:CMP-2-keto-3-deoxyoctulosonic acid synthetase
MAHYEQVLRGDVDALVAHLDRAIPAGSISAKLEDRGDHRIGDARMVVRVYERYSAAGGNRVSLCISVLAVGDEMSVSAITAGGSRAVFWKLNTFGESAFLARAVDALRDYSA